MNPSFPLGAPALLLHAALAAAALLWIWATSRRDRLFWSATAVLLPFLGPLLWWLLGREPSAAKAHGRAGTGEDGGGDADGV